MSDAEPGVETRYVVRIVKGDLHMNNVHDIAILQLNSPVEYSDYIKPICMPRSHNDQSIDKSTCVAAGYGSVGVGKFCDNIL